MQCGEGLDAGELGHVPNLLIALGILTLCLSSFTYKVSGLGGSSVPFLARNQGFLCLSRQDRLTARLPWLLSPPWQKLLGAPGWDEPGNLFQQKG
jgi:hypothetical protein